MLSLYQLSSKLGNVKIAIMNHEKKEVYKRLNKVIRYVTTIKVSDYLSTEELEQIETNMELIDICIDQELFSMAEDAVDKCIILVENKFMGVFFLHRRLSMPNGDIGSLQRLPQNALELIQQYITSK